MNKLENTYINFVLYKKNKFSLKARGSSMLPLLKSGDLVYYQRINFSKLLINDLVLVKKQNFFFTHRVIYKTPKYVITKGDNNLESDGKVFPKQIISKVIKVKRGSRELTPESLYLIQSTHYLQEIVKINTAFAQKGLKYLFLKGLPLHLYYEKAHPRRLYADCDVLVNSKYLSLATKILKKHGYQQANKELSAGLKKIKNYEPELVFYKKLASGFMVTFDLHQELVFQMTELGKLNNFYSQNMLSQFTSAAFFKKRLIRLNKASYPIFSANYLILYLALHLFHHNFEGAFRYQFLCEVIKKESGKARFSWAEVEMLIKKYRLQSFVYPVFVLLKKYYFAKLPSKFLQSIKPQSQLQQKVVTRIIKNTDIFSTEPRIKAGIRRFTYLFLLSPESLWRRVLVFFQPSVLFSILWVIKKRLYSAV